MEKYRITKEQIGCHQQILSNLVENVDFEFVVLTMIAKAWGYQEYSALELDQNIEEMIACILDTYLMFMATKAFLV